MNSELRTAIAEIGNSISELTGGFWYLEAKQITKFPYSVFYFITNVNSRDTHSKFEEFYLQINIYDRDGENIELIKEKIFQGFDDSENKFNLGSYFFERIEKQFTRATKADGIFQISIQYKIELTKK